MEHAPLHVVDVRAQAVRVVEVQAVHVEQAARIRIARLVVDGMTPILVAGLFYLVITVPLSLLARRFEARSTKKGH